MLDQLPAIVVLAPLFGALVTGLAGPSDHRRCFPIVISVLTISLLGAIALLGQVIATGPVDYFMGGWDDEKSVLGVGIQLRVDTINGILLIVIATVAMLIQQAFSYVCQMVMPVLADQIAEELGISRAWLGLARVRVAAGEPDAALAGRLPGPRVTASNDPGKRVESRPIIEAPNQEKTR